MASVPTKQRVKESYTEGGIDTHLLRVECPLQAGLSRQAVVQTQPTTHLQCCSPHSPSSCCPSSWQAVA